MAWKTEKNTHKNPAGGRVSSAAYNFVELPEKVISAVENVEELPRHNTYANPNYLNTGYFLIRLTTKTQLYVRCPLTPSQNRAKADDDRKQNYKDKISNQPEFFYTSETSKPVIPGSSLRGMLRNLLEIVSYGKVNFVQSKPKMFYRAVATTDSIGRLYKERTKDIETGFLIKRNDEWLVQPAIKPQSIWGNFETKPYLPIKDIFVQGKVSGFLHFDHPNYKPKIYRISFDGIGKHFTDRRERKRKLVEITQVGDRSQSYAHNGFLVTSGNMLENAPAGSRSDRKKHAIILEADLNQSEIKINSQAVKDYKDSLTDFMQEKFDKNSAISKMEILFSILRKMAK